MIAVLTDSPTFDNVDEFVAALNKARLANRKRWITYIGTVAGVEVRIKTYDTGYLQIMETNGLKHSAPMDMNVGGWKSFVGDAIKRYAA